MPLLAVGSMVSTAEHVREKLKAAGFTCTLANGRFIKPVDYELADRLAENHELLVVLEENVLRGRIWPADKGLRRSIIRRCRY